MGDWVYQVFMSLPSVGQTETSHTECFAASSTHLQNCLFDPGYVMGLARGKKETGVVGGDWEVKKGRWVQEEKI